MNALSTTFAALSDPTRRAILARLSGGEATVGELAEPFICGPGAISLPAVSRHLKVLEDAGLISNERIGKHRRCRLKPETLRAANEWLDFYSRFWSGSLDRLQNHLMEDK